MSGKRTYQDLAAKLAGKNITVHAVAPGPFESQMTTWMLEKFQKQLGQTCPLRRIVLPPTLLESRSICLRGKAPT